MPKVEQRIVITCPADVQHHFDSILPTLQLIESEDSWLKIEKSLMKLEVITKSGGYKFDNFPILFKSVAQSIINSLLSERTKLSGTAADLLNSVAPRLGERFETLVHVFAPSLLLICARTNKVALFRAKKCLLLIAKHCKLPSLLPHLREASKDKSQTMRLVSVEVTMMLLEVVEKDRIGKRVADLEVIIKGTATDRDPEVRQWCKRVFEVYIDRWPERATVFTSSFTPTTRRYLAVSKASSSSITNSTATAPARMATSRPIASATKRVELHDLPRQKPLSQPTKQPAASTSYVSSSSRVPSQSSNKVGRGVQQKTPSSRSGSSSSSISTSGSRALIASTPLPPPLLPAAHNKSDEDAKIDPREEQRLASLRADLLKQATGTPSQGLAARLALQQFEYYLKKKSQKTSSGEYQYFQDENIEPTPFNVAMAKKQSPPKKAPSRIIVAPPPTVRKGSAETINTLKPAQRIISTSSSSSSAISSSTSKGKTKVEGKEVEDVFRSRPIEKATPKITSSISKSMNAREKLLGPSVNAANRANSRKLQNGKKLVGPKVDIGKENIPPNSGLSSIATSGSPARRVMETVQSSRIEVVKEIEPEEEEKDSMTVVAQELKSEKIIPPLASETPLIVDIMETKDEDEPLEAIPPLASETPTVVEVIERKEREEDEEGAEADDPSIGEATLPTSVVSPSLEAIPVISVSTDEATISPLHDWSKITKSLQEAEHSMTAASSNFQSGPPMSTPIRKPLGALQDNKSQSSPVASLITKSASKVLVSTPIPFASPVTVSSHASPVKVIAEVKMETKRPMVIAPSRKM